MFWLMLLIGDIQVEEDILSIAAPEKKQMPGKGLQLGVFYFVKRC